jgi:hypothetical protein
VQAQGALSGADVHVEQLKRLQTYQIGLLRDITRRVFRDEIESYSETMSCDEM